EITLHYILDTFIHKHGITSIPGKIMSLSRNVLIIPLVYNNQYYAGGRSSIWIWWYLSVLFLVSDYNSRVPAVTIITAATLRIVPSGIMMYYAGEYSLYESISASLVLVITAFVICVFFHLLGCYDAMMKD